MALGPYDWDSRHEGTQPRCCGQRTSAGYAAVHGSPCTLPAGADDGWMRWIAHGAECTPLLVVPLLLVHPHTQLCLPLCPCNTPHAFGGATRNSCHSMQTLIHTTPTVQLRQANGSLPSCEPAYLATACMHACDAAHLLQGAWYGLPRRSRQPSRPAG
jgi:hypothetical protein